MSWYKICLILICIFYLFIVEAPDVEAAACTNDTICELNKDFQGVC